MSTFITRTTADASAGATSLSVQSTTSMQNGDAVRITLSNNALFNTNLSGAPVGHTINLNDPIPFLCKNGAVVEDLSREGVPVVLNSAFYITTPADAVLHGDQEEAS